MTVGTARPEDGRIGPVMGWSDADRGCPSCLDSTMSSDARRFGGRHVCLTCWSDLSSIERRGTWRGTSRASLLAHYAAEMAVRRAS